MEEDFDFPILTVDSVVFQLIDGELAVLLIQRGFEPFLGVWALPGKYISKTETSRTALHTVLLEKTGVSTDEIELIMQPYAFDSPKRDPRGYAVTVMYIGLARNVVAGAHKGMTNGQNPQFVPLKKLPKLAYDHVAIVDFALQRLRVFAATTNVMAALLPRRFTFSHLQAAYEAVYGKRLDKRNFRKKILSLGLVKSVGKTEEEAAHRPARLYAFQHTKPNIASHGFDEV